MGQVTFYKEAFSRTSQLRRDRLIKQAIQEFAKNGFAGTNINVIAERAEVSIGAMYSYFSSKEDLFLTVVSTLLDAVSQSLAQIDTNESIEDVLFEVFDIIRLSCIENKEYSQIFQHITAQSMAPLAERLSSDFEMTIINFLHGIINQAKQRGELSLSINTQVLAFTIDNLLLMYQLSFSSAYYQERMRLFLDMDPSKQDDVHQRIMIKQMVSIICQQHAI